MDSAGDRPHHEADEHVGADAGHAGQLASHDDVDLEDSLHEHAHHGPIIPHESPWTMTVPLIVLAVLSTFGGLLGVPYALSSLTGGHPENYFEHTLEPAVMHAPEHAEAGIGSRAGGEPVHGGEPGALGAEGAAPRSVGEGAQHEPAAERVPDAAEISQERLFTLISLAIAVLGIIAGWAMFARRPLARMPRLLVEKYYVDEGYNWALINPLKWFSREGLWKLFDVGVIDGIVNGIGRGMTEIGGAVRYLQIGFVRSYAALILLSALAVIAVFAYYGLQTFGR
jgi:NADH-quinone oxidoreductase subunit L